MHTITLSTLLLVAVFLLSTTADSISFRKLSRRLTRLRAPQICLARKNADLELFGRQLMIARRCLPFDERVKLQALCRRKRATMETKAACDKLAACPKVRPIKLAIREAEMRKCPPLTPRFPRVERRWRRRLNRRIRKAGLPDPVYPTIILEPRRKKATSAVVLLHGVGDSAINRLPIAEDIRKALPSTRIILPQAPQQFVTFFNSTRASWFDILGNTVDAPQATDEILAAAAGVAAIGDVQKAVYGLPRNKVAIFGISQGGAVALTTYLRHKWGAAIGVSTFLPLADSYPAELGNGTVDVELLMIHGTADMVVPFPIGVLSRDIIRAVGRKVRWVKLTGDHLLPFEQDIVNEEIIAQLKGSFA